MDFLGRKPEPKFENPLNYQEINKLYEEERKSRYDDIINKFQDSSGQIFEKEGPASEWSDPVEGLKGLLKRK